MDSENSSAQLSPPFATTSKAQCQCPHPPEGRKPRNLVVCVDGTSNKFGKNNTNIIEFYSHIVKSEDQLTYYNSGIGTYAKPSWRSFKYLKQCVVNTIDLAIAWNLDKVIMAAYRWLSEEYRDGDKIYLIGFSRGAYQVRAIAGMIHCVGLILPGNNEQIPFAYELYSDHTDGESTELAKTFKNTFSRKNVGVHFVGVWDTVSSVGFFRGKTLPFTTQSCDHICYFRQALALDERRVKFLPEYVYGGRADESDDRNMPPHIKEVWFAGTHSDVGGGNRVNKDLQSGDIPLLWMRNEAIVAGLRLYSTDITWKLEDLQKKINESLTWGWWPLEVIPMQRPLYRGGDQSTTWDRWSLEVNPMQCLLYRGGDQTTIRPHLGRGRKIVPGQKVHASVLFKSNYQPRAKFLKHQEEWPPTLYWNEPLSHRRLAELGKVWEKDLFDYTAISTHLEALSRDANSKESGFGDGLDSMDRLAFLSCFDEGKVAIRKANGISILRMLLEKKNEKMRLSASVILCEIDDEAPTYLEGKFDYLQAMCVSKDMHVRCRVAVSLPSLYKHESLRKEVLSEVMLEKIIELSTNEKTDVQVPSTQALSVLIRHDDIVSALFKLRAIEGLFKLLESPYDPVIVAGLGILVALAFNTEARMTLQRLEVSRTLVKLLKRDDRYVTPASVETLCALSEHKDLRATLKSSHVIPTLVDTLCHGSAQMETLSVRALSVLAQYDDVREVFTSENTLNKLVQLLKSKKSQHLRAGVSGLCSLAQHGAIRDQMIQSGAIYIMVKKLRSKHESPFIVHSLSSLAQYEAFRENMIQYEAPSALVEMMTRRYIHISGQGVYGISALESLIEHDDLRHALFEARAIETLMEMLKAAKTKTVIAGTGYIFLFAKHYDSAAKMIEYGILPLLVQALKKPDRTIQLSAARVLGMFGMHDDIRQRLICDFSTELLDMLRGVLGKIQVLGAAAAFRALSRHGNIRDTVTESVAFSYITKQYHDARRNDGVVSKHPQLSRGEILKSINDFIMSMNNGANHDEDLALVVPSMQSHSTLKLVASFAGLLLCCPCVCCCLIGAWALDEEFHLTD